ncbi:hypothetical protein QAD02_014812 [Eretmocerus hayati]|uniref:Uncharacterized protein n=1 Tax=Eretmocerus hayati TaxID=131215 RepID=A0ACC2P6J0_9HYME|nr:hypothetical protein QAD02_014812 [Eretmocerus hayati]
MASKKLLTLVFVREHDKILLGLKKRGFGAGKWNGFGGKVEPGESIAEGALRELKEECGLTALELRKIGLVEFEFENDPNLLQVHVFDTYNYQGQITESEEMQPQWYDVKDIPYEKMWLDDTYWYPYMLRSEPFKGYFLYRGMDHIVHHKIEKLDFEQLDDLPPK